MNRVTFVQSFVENWKKKITRREIISNPDISHFLSGVSYARTHKLNAWVDKKFAIVETRPWKERELSTMAIRQCRDRGAASLPDWFIWITVLIQL